MSEEYRKGKVYIQNHFAGIIAETDEGYEFTYEREYLKSDNPAALSLTMPLTDEVYKSTTLFPFFDGLIPEGWLLNVVARNWKLSINDRFGLLIVACRDCIGDVFIRNED